MTVEAGFEPSDKTDMETVRIAGMTKADGTPQIDASGNPAVNTLAEITNNKTSDQGADLSVSTTALSGGAGVQAIPTGTSFIRFQLKPAALATTAWANIKFGDVSVTVTSSTGTTLAAGEGPFLVNVPAGATHFDAIAGAALTLNWTPA